MLELHEPEGLREAMEGFQDLVAGERATSVDSEGDVALPRTTRAHAPRDEREKEKGWEKGGGGQCTSSTSAEEVTFTAPV